jgi:uncharacterized protein YcfJ
MKFTLIGLAIGAALLSGCASNETKTAQAEDQVISERCFATGSNLPRRECRDVKSVDPSKVEFPTQTQPVTRGAGPL